MSYHPVPPPLPASDHPFDANYQNHDSRHADSVSCRSGQSGSRVESGGYGSCHHPEMNNNQNYDTKSNKVTSKSNLLSSQEFKDELFMQQARLSPNPDSALSIDDKIRMRKENKQAPSVSHKSDQSNLSRLPDKLMNSSSTLQRDKRPFAYSPDVNDPNNRGKLDLSQIKSPIMRRRLMANMEDPLDNIDDNNDDENNELNTDDCNSQGAVGPSSKSQDGPTFAGSNEHQHESENDRQQEPRKSHMDRKGPNMVHMQQIPSKTICTSTADQTSEHKPIVHYREPPIFYNIRETDYTMHERPLHAPIRSQTDKYLDSLNADIAESLESLSLLANNLDHNTQRIRATPSVDDHRHEINPYNGTRLRHYDIITKSNNSRPQQQQQQQQPPFRNVSTFLPHSSDTTSVRCHDDSIFHKEDDAYQRQQSTRPIQHCSGTANERLAADCLLSPATNCFSASSDTGPYSMSPFYGAPLDVDEPMADAWNWTRVNKPVSHGTFCRYQNSANNIYNGLMSNDIDRRPMPRPQPRSQERLIQLQQQQQRQQQAQPQPLRAFHPTPSSSSQDHYQNNLLHRPKAGNGGDRDNIAQVRALQEMTAQLERDVNRLYELDLTLRK